MKQRINDRLKKLSYCNNPINVFNPASETEINDAYSLIKEKIDKTFDPKKTTWEDIRKKNLN